MTNSVPNVSVEKPLQGALFCCTSIAEEVRSELAAWVEELGADHTLDLTSDVTHLLVGATDSKKYQYVAQERQDVKVLLPGFVGAIRDLWMNDRPVDLNALEAEYKCPTLYSLKISITGFEDIAFRNELAKNIVQNGGEYSGDLTKDVTHLIANAPEGKKYEYATAWEIKIVSLKWYKDTLDRGMQLYESKYHPTLHPQQQGLGAWTRQVSGDSRLGKRQRSEQLEEKPSRKLRRTASARFGSQHNDMWNDIVGPRASNPKEDYTAGLRHAKSMSNVPAASLADDVNINQPENHLLIHEPPPSLHPKVKGIFSEKHFATRGFDERKKAVVYQHLSGHGGHVHDRLSELKQETQTETESRFLVVPHEIDGKQLELLERNCTDINIVTELWLEYCISAKLFVPPDDYVLGQPAITINVPAIAKLIVNASGFPQIQTLHISKTMKKLGARYQEKFTPETSVLICNSSDLKPQKIDHAQAWQIPIVSEKWLWQLIKSRRIPSYEPFRITNHIDAHSKRDSQRHHRNEVVRSEHIQQSSSEASSRQHDGSVADDSFLVAVKAIQRTSNFEHLGEGFAQDDEDRQDKNTDNAQDGETETYDSYSNVSNGNAPKTTSLMPMAMPLQEISSNLRSRQPSLNRTKKKLFQQYDGHSGDAKESVIQIPRPRAMTEDTLQSEDRDAPPGDIDDQLTNPVEIVDAGLYNDRASQSKLVSEFFAMKAAAEAAKPMNSKASTKKLLGRALSNLSNSSNKSKGDGSQIDAVRPPLSRASSINSMNTDGLGVPLSMMSRIPSDLKRKGEDINQPKSPSDLDFHAALTSLSTSQLPHPPSPSQPAQLTYADSDEAVALKAHLAEKRRNRAKLGQAPGDPEPMLSREESEEQRQRAWRERKVEKELVDDEAIFGGGRRTRGREKALRAALGGAEVDAVEEDYVFL